MRANVSIAEVRAIATDVRWACENFALSADSVGYDFHMKKYLDAMCAIASTTLVLRLRENGIQANLIVGQYVLDSNSPVEENHCWVELSDGTVVDITATQFGKYNPVVIGTYAELEKSFGMRYHAVRNLGCEYDNLGWRLVGQCPNSNVLGQLLARC